MKKVVNKLIICVFIFMIAILLQNVSKAFDDSKLTSGYYNIDYDNYIISRIEPETDINTFIQKISNEELDNSVTEEKISEFKQNIKICRDKTSQEEVTTGLIGTGMVLVYRNQEFELSVVGDFDGDGKATQVELTNTIRYIVGLQGSELEGIKYESADLTGDGLVDQRDITKFIRYIVYGELDLGKKDITAPIVNLELIKRAISEITVKAIAMDTESGMGENSEYTFYVKKQGESDNAYVKKQSGTDLKLDLTNLEPNTTYTIKVETQDKAGNKGQAVLDVKTEGVPNGTEQGTIIFGETVWANEMASTTIKTEKLIPIWKKDVGNNTTEKFQIEYQVNGTNGVWKKGDYVTGLKHGDVLYARLTDGTNSGTFIFKNIIDDIEPEIKMNVVVDQENLKATSTVISASDNESGIEEKTVYTFYIKESGDLDINYKKIQSGKNISCDFSNLKPNTKYIIKVEVQDKAGNIGKAEQEIEIQGAQIPDATEKGAIIFSTVTWERGQAKVTISTNTNFYIEYQVNGIAEVNWIKGTAEGADVIVNGLNHNDVIYARLTDGTEHGSYASITIIDSIEPKLDITATEGISEITVDVTAQDNETGIDVAEKYIYYIKEANEPDSSYEKIQEITNTTYKFVGLKQDTIYTIKVEIKDKAGNIGTKEISATTGKIPNATEAGSIIFSNLIWLNGQAEVTISTNTNYYIEYQVNGIVEGNWIKGTTEGADVIANGLNHNDVIYARLTDGTSSGNYTTLTIIDTIKPNITLNLTAENQEITATAQATDNETGIDTNETYKFYIKETGADDSTYVEKQNTVQNTITIPNLTIGKNYTIKVEIQDKAGNIGIIEKSILIPDDKAPIVTLTKIAQTSNSVTVEASATDEGGLPTPTIYVFYIKETGASDSTYVEIQNSSSNQCTFTGLDQNKDYTVKVEVADNAGNIGKKELSILTDTIPDGTEAGAINFTLIRWTNGQAEVTISTNTQYTIEYQVNSTSGTWIKASQAGTNVTATGLNHNDIIYARLTDGTNSSNTATLTVIDGIRPIVTLSVTSGSSSEIIATAHATDNETGIDVNETYMFYIKEQGGTYVQKQDTTSTTCKFTGLQQGKDYTIKVEIRDRAGNIGIKETSIKTESIPDGTDTGSIIFSSITWSEGKAEVTISTTTSYYIEYQVNGTTGTWTKASQPGQNIIVTGLNHNDIIYARLTDGTNSGSYATLTIVDVITPNSFTISVTDITPTGFKITGSTTDNETGLKDYTYVIEEKGLTTGKTNKNNKNIGGVNVESTKAESNNINCISCNNSGSTDTSRSNSCSTYGRKWINRKYRKSKIRKHESRSKRRHRNGNNPNSNRKNSAKYRCNT